MFSSIQLYQFDVYEDLLWFYYNSWVSIFSDWGKSGFQRFRIKICGQLFNQFNVLLKIAHPWSFNFLYQLHKKSMKIGILQIMKKPRQIILLYVESLDFVVAQFWWYMYSWVALPCEFKSSTRTQILIKLVFLLKLKTSTATKLHHANKQKSHNPRI